VVRQAVLVSDGLAMMTPAMARAAIAHGEMAPLMSMAGKLSTRNAIIRLKSRALTAAGRIFCERVRVIDTRQAAEDERALKEWFG
jgi:hypothetical protein